jgi:hypothetical protein
MLAGMSSRRINGVLIAVILLSSLAAAAPASACSWAQPPDISELKTGVPLWEGSPAIVGVYEVEYLARSPRLLISGPRAVNIVTRYWGTAPAHLGLEMTGTDAGVWAYSSCGDLTRPRGTVTYWYTNEKSAERLDWGRSWQTLSGIDGSLTAAQEGMLAERFGPPVVLGISFFDNVQARFMLWKWHLLALVAAAGAWLYLRRRRRDEAAAT